MNLVRIGVETERHSQSPIRLLLSGTVFLVVMSVLVALMVAKSTGVFAHSVTVTAALGDMGDGLPVKSDVKYHGVLVGSVTGVTPAGAGKPNYVHIELTPRYAPEIPATVTARVVPSNVFAVSSVQLLDHGGVDAGTVTPGALIPQDHSLETVRLEASLTSLGRIVAATTRHGGDVTVGVLTTIERATSGRGAHMLETGAQLRQIIDALNGVLAPGPTLSTMAALSDAMIGLNTATPDMLSAIHSAVVPLRAVAQQRAQLAALLTGGQTTTSMIATALARNTGTLTGITGDFGPVVDVLARGGRDFGRMASWVTLVSTKFRHVFDPGTQNIDAKIIVEFTPHDQYTRADCPRYGSLSGPDCATAPMGGPTIIDGNPGGTESPAVPMGGNVGQTGSAAEQNRISTLFGAGNAASDLLVGPLLRDNDVRVAPVQRGTVR